MTLVTIMCSEANERDRRHVKYDDAQIDEVAFGKRNNQRGRRKRKVVQWALTNVQVFLVPFFPTFSSWHRPRQLSRALICIFSCRGRVLLEKPGQEERPPSPSTVLSMAGGYEEEKG